MSSPVLSRSGSYPDKEKPSEQGEDDATLKLTHTESREAGTRLVDNLEVIRAEELASQQDIARPKSRASDQRELREGGDMFNPVKETLENPKNRRNTTVIKIWNTLKKFPRVLRYVTYAIPIGALLAVPIFIDTYAVRPGATPVGGAHGPSLFWFGIWLEVVWLSYWTARIIVTMLPHIFWAIAMLFGSSNAKTYRDMGRQLELPTALFIWSVAVISSYDPILNVTDHRVDCVPGQGTADTSPCFSDNAPYVDWVNIIKKITIALLVLFVGNFVEKILIQWIANVFHVRTYSDRIEKSTRDVDALINLYDHAKSKGVSDESDRTAQGYSSGGGTRTPLKALQNNAQKALNAAGEGLNRMAGDITGRKVLRGNHPRKVVLELLKNTKSSQVLARTIYRAFVRPDQTNITMDDIKAAYEHPEDAEACFAIFDRDLNDDISMEELELACNEIHLEKKAIAASLKDLDSVIGKLDHVFLAFIAVIGIIVFVSIISSSAAAALTSIGSVVLGLSWLLSATAQELLQSLIFVFVKHPFDVRDRVTVYGNVGSQLKGDDYYVVKISLLYTEFRKMEGHIVQAPNSLLNTLFILNHRRSQALADPIELKLKFGTHGEQIEELKQRMLVFVHEHRRDYQNKVLTEVRTIDEVYSVTVNFIFFHKSNYQDELIRLIRHNKFATALMHEMALLGIEGPRRMQPGGHAEWPMHLTYPSPGPLPIVEEPSNPPQPYQPTPGVMHSQSTRGPGRGRAFSTSRSPNPPSTTVTRRRGDSRAAMLEAGDFQDVFESRLSDISERTRERELQREVAREQRDREHIRSLERSRTGMSVLGRVSTDRGSQGGDSQRRKRSLFGRPRAESKASSSQLV